MANASFTRDEVILALDVLYFSGDERLNAESKSVVELSELLNRLPIHAESSRREIFRNPHGVVAQIQKFRRSYAKGLKDINTGAMFYQIALEFEGRLDELHEIAEAIRRNVSAYDDICFGDDTEDDGFPEGSLLGHLHRFIELRDDGKLALESGCVICQINPSDVYKGGVNLLTGHLTVPVTKLDAKTRYKALDYITVCPSCHAALHRYRPWVGKENCREILR